MPDLPATPDQHFWHTDLVLAACAVFLSPVNYLRADFAYITLGDVFAIMTLGLMFAQGRLPLHPFGRASAMWYISVLLLVSGLLTGSAMNGDLMAGLIVAGQYCFSLIAMPMLFLQRSRAEVLFLIKVFIFAMVAVMLHGAWYMQFAPDDHRFVTLSGRLASLVERENAAGALTAIAITFSMWLCFIREIRLPILVLVLIPLVWGLLLTGSNTGFFLTGLGLLFLVLLSGALRLLFGMIAIGSLLFIIIYQWGELFLPEIFIKRVFGALESGDMGQAGTFSDRMYLIHEAYDLTRNTIFIGLGADQYRTISAHGAPVHNTYLLLLAEGGVISLLGHFGLMMAGVLIGWPMLIQRDMRWFGVLTLTTIIMLALVQNGLAHFYARFWAVPWFLALGACLHTPDDDNADTGAGAYP